MLYQYLDQNRSRVLERVLQILKYRFPIHPIHQKLNNTISSYNDLLCSMIRTDKEEISKINNELSIVINQNVEEMVNLGYSLSHVVYVYGAFWEAITKIIEEDSRQIPTHDVHMLNLILDNTIAGAVSKYESIRINQSEKKEHQLFGSLIHEIKNSLSSCTMAMELLRTGAVSYEGKTANILRNGLLRINKLVEEFWADIKIESLDKAIEKENFYIRDIFTDLEFHFSKTAEESNLTLEFDIDPDLKVFSDRHLCHTIISNLLSNAVKYTHKNSTVKVRAYLDNEIAKVEVEDECGGIPDGIAKNMFNAFTRESEEKSGLGLGLNICKRAAIKLNGNIIHKNLPGKGCIFTLEIPMR